MSQTSQGQHVHAMPDWQGFVIQHFNIEDSNMAKKPVKKVYYITLYKNFNGRGDVLCMMSQVSFMFGKENCPTVTGGKKVPGWLTDDKGRRYNLFKGDNGIDYHVFGDTSAIACTV